MGRLWRPNGVRSMALRSHLTGIVAAVALICGCGERAADRPSGPKVELHVLCGAGIRPAMEPIKDEFEKQNNCTVRVNYAGSGTLLGTLQAGAEADLYLPGDIWWVHKTREMGLVDRYTVVAWFVPVIAVQKGNPKGIQKLEDLARDNGLEVDAKLREGALLKLMVKREVLDRKTRKRSRGGEAVEPRRKKSAKKRDHA